MIDHVIVPVTDYVKSKAWYRAALAPIGYEQLMELPASATRGANMAAFGETATRKPDFFIAAGTVDRSGKPPVHVAIRVATRALVDAFYKAAMAAGGVDHGGPGLRPHYHAHYYGAFVLDSDGHNIEAVCQTPV